MRTRRREKNDVDRVKSRDFVYCRELPTLKQILEHAWEQQIPSKKVPQIMRKDDVIHEIQKL